MSIGIRHLDEDHPIIPGASWRLRFRWKAAGVPVNMAGRIVHFEIGVLGSRMMLDSVNHPAKVKLVTITTETWIVIELAQADTAPLKFTRDQYFVHVETVGVEKPTILTGRIRVE